MARRGRPPKGKKYPASLQIPCSVQFKESVEQVAAKLGMTPPEFMRRSLDSALKCRESVSEGVTHG